jgi:hypothetical protein
MSTEQARIYSDGLYPPTPDDIAFEQKLRARHETGVPRQAFPWASTVSLLYPILATVSIALYRPAPPLIVAVGYGLANLGFLLLGAGVIAGQFRIFRLQRRLHVFLAAAAAFVVGTVLSNIYPT